MSQIFHFFICDFYQKCWPIKEEKTNSLVKKFFYEILNEKTKKQFCVKVCVPVFWGGMDEVFFPRGYSSFRFIGFVWGENMIFFSRACPFLKFY